MDNLTTVSVSERLIAGQKLGVVTISNPPVNAVGKQVRQDLLEVFQSLASRRDLSGIVLTGANGNFVAGADIREFHDAPVPPHLTEVIESIEACPVPVVAAIDGAALGGGYELALGCDHRLATSRSMVGLPEVTLGLIPGAGGTVRLPRLVEPAEAIAIVTTGRRIRADEAAKLGLIDAVATGDVVDAACALLTAGDARKNRLLGRPALVSAPDRIEMAEAMARKKSKGSEAVEAAIEAIGRATSQPADSALKEEREVSLRLRRGEQSRALRHLFLAERTAARISSDIAARTIATVGVVGAGQMGRGIALALASSGYTVRLTDSNAQALAAAQAQLEKTARSMERSGRTKSADELMGRISLCAIEELAPCELVIEAIIEDMGAKQVLFETLDAIVAPDAILASNTSYLDINMLAARTLHPGRVAGLHFFNPANIMRLVEVIRTDASTPETFATLMKVCRRLGKVGVPARVGEGFIGNRIFSAYRRQCEFLLEEGAYPEEIDEAMRAFGMAMGPFAVFDLAGLEIAWATRKRLAPMRDPNERYVAIADRLCEAGRFGRKTGKGWYQYDAEGRPVPDPQVREWIDEAARAKGITRRPFSAEEIQDRLLSAMINEACFVLSDGIAERGSDIDLVLAHGYGYPKLRGGPLFAAARRRREEVLAAIDEMVRLSGPTAKRAPNVEDVLNRL